MGTRWRARGQRDGQLVAPVVMEEEEEEEEEHDDEEDACSTVFN